MDELNCSEPLLFTKGNTRTRGDIRVNAVCAGTIRTPLVDNLFVKFAEENHCSVEDYWRKENALYMRGSAGQPEEVAEVVYFLASDASSFCTGSHYLVDGGLVAG